MICIPIVGPSMSKAQEQIESALVIADILELRPGLDSVPRFECFTRFDHVAGHCHQSFQA